MMKKIETSIVKWRWTALIVYLTICIYDFMVVPIYYGIARMGLDLADYMSHLQEIEDPLVQMEYLKKQQLSISFSLLMVQDQIM